ncbi:hypothetical protein [Flavobacterium ginsengisoli]|uniref:hypothetical protein n=1 Tax=Flavobacterium ginsengisoli TaxID=871694 RepID=UPI00241578AD|nr:hypothetical protein [Flavobacterium ginsengisoli]
MKNKIIIRAVLSGFCVLLVSCNTKKDENVVIDLKQVKKEIQAKENEYACNIQCWSIERDWILCR